MAAYTLTLSSQQEISKQEMLDALTESILPPFVDCGKVGTSYVDHRPLMSSKKLSYDYLKYVNESGVVIRLDLPEQLYLDKMVSKRFGIKIRHGSLQENTLAAYSVEDYVDNVLAPYWVFTGQVIRRLGKTYDVTRWMDAEFVKVQLSDILERDGKPFETKGIKEKIVSKIALGPRLQASAPHKKGYWSVFSGAIPATRELGKKSDENKGFFGEISYDERDLSAVKCNWNSDGSILDATAVWPSDEDYEGVIGAWTDENPKR